MFMGWCASLGAFFPALFVRAFLFLFIFVAGLLLRLALREDDVLWHAAHVDAFVPHVLELVEPLVHDGHLIRAALSSEPLERCGAELEAHLVLLRVAPDVDGVGIAETREAAERPQHMALRWANDP